MHNVQVAPITARHILKLAKLGAYNSVHFFRVDKGFVAQTADVVYGRLEGAPLDARQMVSPGFAITLEQSRALLKPGVCCASHSRYRSNLQQHRALRFLGVLDLVHRRLRSHTSHMGRWQHATICSLCFFFIQDGCVLCNQLSLLRLIVFILLCVHRRMGTNLCHWRCCLRSSMTVGVSCQWGGIQIRTLGNHPSQSCWGLLPTSTCNTLSLGTSLIYEICPTLCLSLLQQHMNTRQEYSAM